MLLTLAVAMPNAALGLACSAPVNGPPPLLPPQLTPHSAAEAIPEETSTIATMSAVANRTVSFFLNTSCVLLPRRGGVNRPRPFG